MHLSAYAGHKEIVELLIKNNADLSVKDKDGAASLHYAAAGGQMLGIAGPFRVLQQVSSWENERTPATRERCVFSRNFPPSWQFLQVTKLFDPTLATLCIDFKDSALEMLTFSY